MDNNLYNGWTPSVVKSDAELAQEELELLTLQARYAHEDILRKERVQPGFEASIYDISPANLRQDDEAYLRELEDKLAGLRPLE